MMEPIAAAKRIHGMRNRLLLSLLIACLLAVTLFRPAEAQSGGLSLTARAGFDGVYRTYNWVPVQVTAANSGPAVSGELRVTLGSAASGDLITFSSPIDLPTQSNKRVTLYVYPPRFTTQMTVELVDDNGRSLLTQPTNRLTQLGLDGLLYGVVTATPGDLDFLQNVTEGRPEAAVAYLSLDELPDLPAALMALDVLVFHDVDTGQLTPAQRTALDAWVDMGGQLVVTGGPGWQKTAVSLADLLPVTLSGSETVADLPALSQATGVPFRDPGPYLVTTSSLRRGELLFHQDGLPLLARQDQGRGSVYFLALDPSLAPLVDWAGGPLLWSEVARRVPAPSPWAAGVRSSYAANQAVGSLPSVALPSVLQLMAYLLVYVVLIGPVNYAILKRRNRRELAWLTIPALVLVFTVLSYFTGFQFKGNNTIINEMSVVYGAVNSDQMRVQSLLGLYSPNRRAYDLVLPAETMGRPLTGGFGGSGYSGPISRGSEVVLHNVRVDVGGVQPFVADSLRHAPTLTGEATLRLNDGDIELVTTLRNESQMTLQNATLLVGTTAVSLGDLQPGQSINEVTRLGRAGTLGTTTPFGPSYGYGSPLLANAPAILGTSDYYNDRSAYPRWQLLQALEEEFYGGSGRTTPNVLLVGWTDESQIAASLDNAAHDYISTTLYLLQIPMRQELQAGQVSVPRALLNWEITANSGVYPEGIENFYMPPGTWLEISFQPWPDFQSLQATGLALYLQEDRGIAPPTVLLWDWAGEEWVALADVVWGETAVANPAPFIGPNNSVQLRLENGRFDGLEVMEVYPILSGMMNTSVDN
jgi:hypothetical protein